MAEQVKWSAWWQVGWADGGEWPGPQEVVSKTEAEQKIAELQAALAVEREKREAAERAGMKALADLKNAYSIAAVYGYEAGLKDQQDK